MYKLFSQTHGFLSLLRNRSTKPKTFSPRSHFHSSRSTQISDSKLGPALKVFERLESLKLIDDGDEEGETSKPRTSQPLSSSVEISHPWPEWVELMELLLKKDYFAGGGTSPFGGGEMDLKDTNRIRNACLNFGRDRFDLIRYFSRRDTQLIVGSGCPSLDRKVVNSGKRLRAHVGVEEGNVCSLCSLRGSCERAYVKAREDEGGRTVDVMRILLTYGLDPVTGSVENNACLNKLVKEAARRLLKEVVEFSGKEVDSYHSNSTSKSVPFKPEPSNPHQMLKGQIHVPMKQGDWICPKCNFLNFAKNIKCLRCNGIFQERLKKLGEDRDHLPLKKGDWLCDKCNFLNFAKNTKCLQCKEKPSNRTLNPGEWECVSCNYVNFRRNMVCLKCDWKRPKAFNSTETTAPSQHEQPDHHQHPRISFVKEDNMCWNNQDDDDFSLSKRTSSDFEDFPIVGGKGVISQNPNEREKWKEEMSKRRKGVSNLRERGSFHDLGSGKSHRSLQFSESGDEDEMAEWFGYGKKTQST